MNPGDLDEIERLLDSVMPGGSRFGDRNAMWMALMKMRMLIDELRAMKGEGN